MAPKSVNQKPSGKTAIKKKKISQKKIVKPVVKKPVKKVVKNGTKKSIKLTPKKTKVVKKVQKPVKKKLVKKNISKKVIVPIVSQKSLTTTKSESVPKKVVKNIKTKTTAKKKIVKKLVPVKKDEIKKIPIVEKPEVKKQTAVVKKNLAHSMNAVEAKTISAPVKKTMAVEKKNKSVSQESWLIQYRTLILVTLVAVIIVNSWIFLTTPVYAPAILQQQITNPVYDAQASYFKYEVPESDWNNFDGKKMVEKIVASGVKFDEAIYQQGGKTCDVCPSAASPLLYLKNPSYFKGSNWTQVAKPNFYDNSQRYPIYQFLLQ